MMQQDDLIRLSKFLSLMLRHEPSKYGLELDPEGYVAISDVLLQVRRKFASASVEDVRAVVATIEPDKQRFSVEGDDIRANYGHSIAERISHQAVTPPDVLWHGTNSSAVEAILRGGLLPMKRQYVHLTPDQQLALRVGARRGKPVLVSVDASAAFQQGIQFYRANESFWLVDSVPAEFLRVSN